MRPPHSIWEIGGMQLPRGEKGFLILRGCLAQMDGIMGVWTQWEGRIEAYQREGKKVRTYIGLLLG